MTKIPYAAIQDAKKLMQWKPGNVCFGDSYFAMGCKKKYGEEVFKEACKQVEYIPITSYK